MISSIEFRAMNTSVMLAAEGDGAIPGMYAAKMFIDDCEQRFSRFLPASELTELNRSTGTWLQISDELLDMLQLSMKYHKATKGIFDPSILSDLKQAGYDRSMDEIRANGVRNLPEVSNRISRPAFEEIRLDIDNRRVRMPRGLEIDLGGIAKGWIVEKAALLLHKYAEACGVSAGGDILFIGHPRDGMDWDVSLEDPRNPAELLTQLHIPAGAIATSSIMKRTWRQGEKIRHHLIDPRTGEPAKTDWLSVTVISPSVIEADVFAKVILIAAEKELSELVEAKELTFIAVDSDGNLSGSANYKDYLYEFTSESI